MTASIERRKVLGRGKGKPPAGFADVFYLKEIEFQCELALRSFGEIRQRLAAGSKDLGLIAFSHTMLIFAGNVSKLLFAPSGRRGKERANRLRRLLAIEDTQLREVREARNYLEHFDERIDHYLDTHKGILLHRVIDDELPHEVELDGRRFVPGFLQFFNTKTLDLVLYNRSINLQSLGAQIQQLQGIVSAHIAKLEETSATP